MKTKKQTKPTENMPADKRLRPLAKALSHRNNAVDRMNAARAELDSATADFELSVRALFRLAARARRNFPDDERVTTIVLACLADLRREKI